MPRRIVATPALSGAAAMDRPENHTTNTVVSRAIRVTNRTANRGRRVLPVGTVRMNRADGEMITGHGAMSAGAVAAVVGCIRVRAAESAGAVRAGSASGR